MKRVWYIGLLCFFLVACGNGAGGNQNNQDQLEKVKVVLDWTPNTNHTGLYVAQSKGYFAEEGLDVEIMLPGEAGADQLVASGQAEFGISYQESITEARIQGVPIVSIAAIIQHNTSGFASPKEKNIISPKDFEGKTYGGWGAPLEKAVLDSLMSEVGANVEKVNILNIGDTDFFTAVKRDIDFAWIYYGWTGVEAELRGESINIVYLTDYSEKLDYYTPVLATSEKNIEKNPDLVRKFVSAVSKGYLFAIEKPEEAAEILIKAVPELDPELVKESQRWLANKYQDDAPKWGHQKLEVWENYGDWMYERGLLDQRLDAEKAFTNEFLP